MIAMVRVSVLFISSQIKVDIWDMYNLLDTPGSMRAAMRENALFRAIRQRYAQGARSLSSQPQHTDKHTQQHTHSDVIVFFYI